MCIFSGSDGKKCGWAAVQAMGNLQNAQSAAI